MKTRLLILSVILMVTLAAAQTAPAASPQAKPADKKPLQSLPYTPSLDVNSMDTTTDPCVDFYQYTCGGWMKNNPIPPDQTSWSVYGKLANENQQFLWGILEDLGKPGVARTPVQQKIGDLFASCMDVAALEKLGAVPLKPTLDSLAAIKSTSGLVKYLAARNTESYYYGGPLFTAGSDQDFGDASQIIASVGAGGLGLPDRDYYFKTDAKSVEIRKKYVEHVTNMLVLLGEPKEKAAADAQTVLRMETDLANATLTRVEKREPHNLYHKMSPAELQQLMPDFNWKEYFADSGFADVQTLNLDQPKFFAQVEKMLKTENLDDWKVYLRWFLVHGRARYLSHAFVEENFNFYSKYLRGAQELPPRWKTCVSYVDHNLGEALGEEFVRRTFTADTRQRTLKMTEQIEQAMADEIRQLPWMSDATKQEALKKLDGIRNKIGYPAKWRDYSAVTIERDDFLGNILRAVRFETRRQINKIGKPVDRDEWDITPPTVNAYYNPQMNDINFPAGVLQPPLFDPKLDDAPNYGNTGGTIGHELTHGFDDEGRQFDPVGNLRDWWTKDDAEKFEEKINCIRDEYAQFTIVDDIKINSKLTSGEDVADLGGLLLAYLAWKVQTKEMDLKPAEGFTPDQRFFIGYAQWACEIQRPENLRANAITNEHSPGKYRVNGLVNNMPEFWHAFQCKAAQPMVSPKPCKVW